MNYIKYKLTLKYMCNSLNNINRMLLLDGGIEFNSEDSQITTITPTINIYFLNFCSNINRS